MTSSLDASIIPITLTVNGKVGLTLWAPPWEDEEGELWQGFLGDGAKIVLFPGPRELADFIASGEENDLSDHPAWGRVLKLTAEDLRPSGEDAYDLDEVYTWAAGEPDPVHVSALANVVDMVANIAECCDDGALRGLVVNTADYSDLVSDDVSYQGKEGSRRWSELGDQIAETWERAITRVESWCKWVGDFSESDLEAETVWDRVGAEPIELIFGPDEHYLTVRGYGAGDEVTFLSHEQEVFVFTDVATLAEFCRTSKHHNLHTLEWWEELADVEDDEVFEPEDSYDLSARSTAGAEVLRELIAFIDLDIDEDDLGDPIEPDVWNAAIDEIKLNLKPQE